MKISKINFSMNVFFVFFDLAFGLYDLFYLGAIKNDLFGWIFGPIMLVLMLGMIWIVNSQWALAKRWGWK